MSEISHGDVRASTEASFVNHAQHFLTLAIVHLKQTTDKLVTLTVIYCIISVLAYFLYLLIKRFVKNASQNDSSMKRVLIVTAHPDDECMFFGPTILNLRLRNVHVSLLCMSAGDSPPNSKQVRKEELWQSCKALGLNESHLELRQHSLLKDGHLNNWSHKLIGTIILTHIETWDIDTVITFDEQGVSEHPNHIAVFEAMAYLTLNHLLPRNVCFYSLDTVNRLRKYSSMLDFLTSFFLSKSCLILSLKQQYQVVKALACHQSQFVWFRKLYILISRYATINTHKLWTYDELKDYVKYEDMVAGLKNKNMWYKSLDDSLKKINSEQVMPVQTEEMSEDQSGPDTEDDDVSFIVKPGASTLEQSDPRTLTKTEPNATERKQNERSVPPPKIKPKLASSDLRPKLASSEVKPASSDLEPKPVSSDLKSKPVSIEVKPKPASSEESVHNGEVFVRCPKSRFLIPKTYRNFYNSTSSSSSSSEGSVDDTATSSGSPEETPLLTTGGGMVVKNEQNEPKKTRDTIWTDANIISCKIEDKSNSELRAENNIERVDKRNIGNSGIEDSCKIDIRKSELRVENIEKLVDASDGLEDIEQVDISDGRLEDSEDDVEDEDNNESYEIEDIESALNEFEKEDDVDDQNDDDVEENNEASSNFDDVKNSSSMENIQRVVEGIQDIGGTQEQVARSDNELESAKIMLETSSKGDYTTNAKKIEKIKTPEEDYTLNDNTHIDDLLDNNPVIDGANSGVDVDTTREEQAKEPVKNFKSLSVVNHFTKDCIVMYSEQLNVKDTELEHVNDKEDSALENRRTTSFVPSADSRLNYTQLFGTQVPVDPFNSIVPTSIVVSQIKFLVFKFEISRLHVGANRIIFPKSVKLARQLLVQMPTRAHHLVLIWCLWTHFTP
uniref:N-acetylglucosaminylphosphatidylinositol deacetylase n=1 Tax=Cacopsylla melanoneura TaxID=428564 RepID=A0A8D8YV19_9HEMI